jgi:hypothetical protein
LDTIRNTSSRVYTPDSVVTNRRNEWEDR